MPPAPGAVIGAGEPAGADAFPMAPYVLMSLGGGPELLRASLDCSRALQLQEQLHRFMAMNEDLRHKVAVVQAQLKSALEKKSDLEAAMLQTQRETSRRSRTSSDSQRPKPSLVSLSLSPWPSCCQALLMPARPSRHCAGLLACLDPLAANNGRGGGRSEQGEVMGPRG